MATSMSSEEVKALLAKRKAEVERQETEESEE